MKQIRVIIVGCGRVSLYHERALAQMERFAVVGVCDSDPIVAARAENRFSAPQISFESIEPGRADLVVISTPSGMHFQHALTIVKKGIDVLIEKPIVLASAELQELIDHADQGGTNIFVVRQQRFLPSIVFLRSHLPQLGQIFTIQLHLFWNRSQAYYAQADWRGTTKGDGGLLFNQGVHSIDLLTWLFGEINTVKGFSKTLARDIEIDDTTVLALEFASGALGTLSATTLASKQNFEAGFTIIAENGIVRLGGISFERIEHWEIQGVKASPTLQRASDYVYKNGHFEIYKEIEKFYSGDSKTEIVTAREAFHAIAAIETFYKTSNEILSIPKLESTG